jgi:virulence factor Mce-like protein
MARKLAHHRTGEERMRSHVRIGGGLLAVLAVLLYFAFGGAVPFKGGYDVRAVVSDAVALHGGSPVRIAGVNVGKVTGVERGPGHTAIVKMRIDDAGRPIHRDATLKIRPRLFLEGNFFVDLKAGSPSAPELPDDGTLPLSQTSVPVQFDQVLDALQSDTRDSLKTVLNEYRTALDKGGAQAINRSFEPAVGAFEGIALASEESRGLQADDVSRLIASGERVMRALTSRRGALADLVTSFNRTVGAFADQERAVSQGTRDLAAVTREARPALGELNTSLPSLRRFADESRPLIRRSPRTLDLSFPFLRELDGLVSEDELPPLVADLRPTLRTLAPLVPALDATLASAQNGADCTRHNALPTLNSKLDDGPLSTGQTAWQEFLHSNVGLASATQNFDGNGFNVRLMAGAGDQSVSVGRLPGGQLLYGVAQSPLLGSRPAKPDHKPPFRPDVPCSTQERPNLEGAVRPAPPPVSKLPVYKPTKAEIAKALDYLRKKAAAVRKGAAR